MGHVITNDDGKGIEHFGFVDGRSQPLFLRSDFKNDEGTIEAVEGGSETTHNWEPFESLEEVLVRDPYVNDDLCHGSFLVFRKLEQNVKLFRTALGDLAGHLTPNGDDRVARAGAMVVGRFEDGTPIVMADHPLGRPTPANDFDYDADSLGRGCPIQAHIRKVNPRGISGEPAQEAHHRITRRSLTYGTHVRIDAGIESLPERDVGVLFMCYQASIRRHFAFMQNRWANNVAFTLGDTGADALVGQGDRSFHRWPPSYGSSSRGPCTGQQFVHLKGGEFFFAPSMPFLEAL
jgi:Dyp-type peroxidase family